MTKKEFVELDRAYTKLQELLTKLSDRDLLGLWQDLYDAKEPLRLLLVRSKHSLAYGHQDQPAVREQEP